MAEGDQVTPKFRHWLALADVVKTKTGVSTYELAAEKLRDAYVENSLPLSMVDACTIQAENVWHASGRPYYKVWPNMIDAMASTKLNFNISHFRLPYLAINILLPLKHPMASRTGPSILVAMVEKRLLATTLADFRLLNPSCDATAAERAAEDNVRRIKETEDKYGRPYYGDLQIYYRLPSEPKVTTLDVCALFEDATVEECVKFLLDLPEADHVDTIGNEWLAWMSKVVIAVAMFGIDSHDMVMPDVPQETIVIKGKTKNQRLTSQLRANRALAECHGWKVGSEIDLPRPLVHRENGRPHNPTGRELEYGHIRSGHMKMQPCGKRNEDRKLIFVAPTVVRPDLPIRTRHGYRIQDKLLT